MFPIYHSKHAKQVQLKAGYDIFKIWGLISNYIFFLEITRYF